MTMQANDPPPAQVPARAAIYAALLCFMAVPMALFFLQGGVAASDETANGFFVTMSLFVVQDMWVGPLMGLAILAAWRFGDRFALKEKAPFAGAIPMIALAAVALSITFRFLAHHNYPLSLDEFMPTFQAAIFRGGQLMAPLSDRALALNGSLQPHFTYVDEVRQVWI